MLVQYSQNADKQLEALPQTDKERITKKLIEISKNPKRYIEGLTNLEYKKIRIGHLRLLMLYVEKENKLFIREILQRKKAYK